MRIQWHKMRTGYGIGARYISERSGFVFDFVFWHLAFDLSVQPPRPLRIAEE